MEWTSSIEAKSIENAHKVFSTRNAVLPLHTNNQNLVLVANSTGNCFQ